jgi:organic radical activating enzyme
MKMLSSAAVTVKLDRKTGLLFNNPKHLIPFKDKEFSNIKTTVTTSLMEKRTEVVNDITIFPVQQHCEGSCIYCINDSNDKRSYKVLTLEKVEKEINYLKENSLIRDYCKVQLLGGDPILHPNLEDVISTISELLENTKIVLTIFSSFFTEEDRNKLDKIVKKVIDLPNIEMLRVIITLDLGAVTRKSNVNKISHSNVKDNSLTIINKYRGYEKVQLHVHSNLSVFTKPKILKDELNTFLNEDVLITLQPVYTTKRLRVPLETVKEIIEMLENNFEIAGSISQRKIVIKNGYFLNTNLTGFKLNIIELIPDELYLPNPVSHVCSAFKSKYGFSQTEYIACSFGFFKLQDREQLLQPDLAIIDEFRNSKIDKCDNCEIYSLCPSSICTKKKVKCDNSLEYYFKYITKKNLENKELLEIENR